MKEQIIVSLTTWKPRLRNIPTVLDSIFTQSLPPDHVVLNLASDEELPEDIAEYLRLHDVEVCCMPDLKVYKKLVPTLKKYPDACVISIDDDWVYPPGMIEDFMAVHAEFPDCPVSGNRVTLFGLACHCGCASLTKAEYFGPWLDCIDHRVMKFCASDDLAYTYFIARTGRRYVRTKGIYSDNMQGIVDGNSYSESMASALEDSWEYLQERFGYVFLDRILVHFHINHPNCVPGFLTRLRAVCGPSSDIVVTYSEEAEEISAILECFPKARLLKVEYSEDGIASLTSLLNEAGGYDYVLHMTTWNGEKVPFYNSLNLPAFHLSRLMLSALISSRQRLLDHLEYLDRHPRTAAICALEGFRTSLAICGRSFRECCPASIFLCRADASLFEGKCPRVRTVISYHRPLAKLLHYLFSVERYQPERKKILMLFGIPIRLWGAGNLGM